MVDNPFPDKRDERKFIHDFEVRMINRQMAWSMVMAVAALSFVLLLLNMLLLNDLGIVISLVIFGICLFLLGMFRANPRWRFIYRDTRKW
jgi:hypothetical protein